MKRSPAPVFIKWLYIMLLASVACTSSTTKPTVSKMQTAPVQNQITAAQLLQNVNQYVQQYFRGWRLAQPSDYSKSWWSFYDSSAIAQPAVTDVNDDKKADYGLLLIKGDSLQMVVLLGANQSFTHWVALPFQQAYRAKQNNLEHCITIEPPGQIDIAYPTIQSLVLPSNAFNLMQMENRAAIYYYTNGTMNVFKTQ